ncbi:MAG TPA: pilus assembly protein TadG-related protein [Gammaproteobacteria bacterium]
MVIVMLVLVIVILLGVAALALDLGRLYVLKSEMQNAADAAALAGAAELNAEDDAIERAEAAARGLLQHDSHFAKVKALLGTDIDITITFYCSIGGEQDSGAACPGDADETDSNKILLSSMQNDVEAHYIRVTLDPEANNEDRYGIDLYFLPVLSVLGIDTSNTAVTTATALAGRHFYMCRFPPVMLCDEFEGIGGFRANMADGVGKQIALKLQGGPNAQWAPGMFGFLDPDQSHAGGAKETAQALAYEGDLDCPDTPLILPETGQMAEPGSAAINTRFDEYGAPFFNKASDKKNYPPAENVTSYGGYDGLNQTTDGSKDGKVIWRDSNLQDLSNFDEGSRIGNGDWDRVDYFEGYHSEIESRPANWNTTITRQEVYDWEINSGNIPKPPEDGEYDTDFRDRRVFYLAVVSCNALEVKPGKHIPIVAPDGFAKVFITERAGDPSDGTNLLVEYMGWATEEDDDYHVTVQLYE